MADPFVTYTFVNGTGNIIDADQVNRNNTDLLGAISSGSSATLAAASFSAGYANITNLRVANGTLNSAIVSAATPLIDPAIAAYDYTDIVSAQVSYVSGVFTATVSGITDGAGNQRTFTASYIRQKNLVHVFFPAHNGTTDTGFQGQGYEQELAYVITGFPTDISPSATKTIDMPQGALYSGTALYANTIGIFGDNNWSGSGLSCLAVQNQSGYWGGGTAAKGYNRPVVIVYSL